MKKLALLALVAATTSIFADPAPLFTIPTPIVTSVTKPITFVLSANQVTAVKSALVSSLSSVGVTIPAGANGFESRAITSGTNAGGSIVRINFAQ